MSLHNRLTKLELKTRLGRSIDPDASRNALLNKLEVTSKRLAGTTFSNDWCLAASPMEIASAAWCELSDGTRSEVLWQKITELSQQGNIASRLFKNICDES